MPSVGFYTLGCKLNFSETSTLARQFAGRGYQPVPFHDAADVYVINTCSVTDNADKKCRKVVRQALRKNPQAAVVVVGCYAQLKPQEIAEIPGVSVVLGAAEKFALFEHIDALEPRRADAPRAQVFHGDVGQATGFTAAASIEERTRAFLKVQDGCDYKCTFCTIPLARGRSRSDTVPQVLARIHELGEAGVQEVVLTGVNLGDFGAGTDYNFTDLVHAICDTPTTVGRFRISSIEPNLLTDSIIERTAVGGKFMPHFHLPLQSGSNTILARMRRRYRRELYADRVARIRQLMPDACIGVDVLTGFPGETEALFQETYDFINSLDVSYLHVFPYSERENTMAADMDGAVPVHIREQRGNILRQLSDTKRTAFATRFVGQTRPVLVEAEADGGYLHGFTDNYVKLRLPYDPLLVNEVVAVEIGAVIGPGLCEGYAVATEPEHVATL